MTKHRARTSDEPALDPRVRELFAAAAAPVETTSPLPGEDEALAAFRRSPQRTRMSSRLPAPVSAKAAVAAALGACMLLIGGFGAAAAGILPGPAQQTASTVLKTVGISVPAGEGADKNGRPEPTSGDRVDKNTNPHGSEAEVPPTADPGNQVSQTAKNTPAHGAHKGQDIAGVGSDGRANPGNHGSAGEHHGQPPGSHPNNGGTGPASGAANGQEHSDGAAGHGTAQANESSNGTSSNGSGNGSANSGGSGDGPADH